MQEGVFIAFQRTYIQTIITFGTSLVNLGASIALLAAGYGVIPVLGVYVAVQYLMAIAFFVAINVWLTRVRARFRIATARRLLGQMKAFIGSSALGALFARPEIVILTLVASEAQIGYYAAALKVVDVWYFIPATFAMNVYPLLSRSLHTGRRRLQEIQDKSLRFLMAFSLPVSVATFVFAEPLVDLLYGDDLAPAVEVLRILSLNVCLYALFELMWRVLSARDEQGAVLRVQAVTTVTRLGGGVALIVPFAAVGAAINMVANTVLHIVLLGLRIRTDGTRVALARIAARPAAAAALMGGLGWLLLPAIGFVPAVACAVTAYLLLAVGIGAVSRDDVEFLRRRARPL
jgi:O-antigen/teichoic acid export membrane protein